MGTGDWIGLIILFTLVGVLVGVALGGFALWKGFFNTSPVYRRLVRHFRPASLEQLTITHRRFPAGMAVPRSRFRYLPCAVRRREYDFHSALASFVLTIVAGASSASDCMKAAFSGPLDPKS